MSPNWISVAYALNCTHSAVSTLRCDSSPSCSLPWTPTVHLPLRTHPVAPVPMDYFFLMILMHCSAFLQKHLHVKNYGRETHDSQQAVSNIHILVLIKLQSSHDVVFVILDQFYRSLYKGSLHVSGEKEKYIFDDTFLNVYKCTFPH